MSVTAAVSARESVAVIPFQGCGRASLFRDMIVCVNLLHVAWILPFSLLLFSSYLLVQRRLRQRKREAALMMQPQLPPLGMFLGALGPLGPSHPLSDAGYDSSDDAASVASDFASPSSLALVSGKASASSSSASPSLAGVADAYVNVSPAKRPKKQKQPRPVSAEAKDIKWKTRLSDRATAAVNLEAKYEQLPPHVVFDLLADPTHHEEIFDEIKVSLKPVFSVGIRPWHLQALCRMLKLAGTVKPQTMLQSSPAGTVAAGAAPSDPVLLLLAW